MRLAFLVGSLDISGGTYVIFEHAQYAAHEGHDVTLVTLLPQKPGMLAWHPAGRQLASVPLDAVDGQTFDLAIATWWQTALELHRIRAKQYAYFVQSIESRFYAAAQAPLRSLVDETYDLPLPGITEAKWIKQYLSTRHSKHYHLVPNGIRKDVYRREGERVSPRSRDTKLRVLVEGPFSVPFKNVGRTLKLMRRAHADETWLLTASPVGSMPGITRVFSRVPIAETARIYRSCDVLVKLSLVEGMFGPPLEMFHCGGTAVVYRVTGHDEYIEHGVNALVIEPGDEDGVIEAVQRLRADPDLLERLKEGAMVAADRWPSWSESSRWFLQALDELSSTPAVDRAELRERSRVATDEYVRTEADRLAGRPTLQLQTSLAKGLSGLPPSLKQPLRKMRYILETL